MVVVGLWPAYLCGGRYFKRDVMVEVAASDGGKNKPYTQLNTKHELGQRCSTCSGRWFTMGVSQSR